MAIDEREEETIRALVERLTDAYSATRTRDEIKSAVAAAHATFKDRRIRDFVPVLVERRVRAALDQALAGR